MCFTILLLFVFLAHPDSYMGGLPELNGGKPDINWFNTLQYNKGQFGNVSGKLVGASVTRDVGAKKE
jgi:hypothetical protein